MTAISGVEFLIWLLIAASAIALLTKYLRIPYTVALVLGGLLLSLLRLPFLSPLQPDQRPHWLTPDVILILFLPALVFEGSVKIDVRDLLRDSVPLFSSSQCRGSSCHPGDWFVDSLDDRCADSDSAAVRGDHFCDGSYFRPRHLQRPQNE